MKQILRDLLFVFLGSGIFAYGLEGFLVPNELIDGGIVGISMLTAHLTNWNLSVLLLIFNLPFIWLGWKKNGLRFALFVIFSLISASLWLHFLHKIQPFTTDLMLATCYGGVIIGVGVGLVLRNGGSLDGVEVSSILVSRKTPFTVGEMVLFFNLFIMFAAGFVFGWEKAMYSFLTYYIASKAIDFTVEGLDTARSVMIITQYAEPIGNDIQTKLGRGVTYLIGEGGYSKTETKMVYCVITRFEENTIKQIVTHHDPSAFITITHIHEVKGGRFAEKH